MIGFDFSKIASSLSLSFETELCEALNWDEEETEMVMKKLVEYFSVCTKSDPDIVKADLEVIFPEEVCKVVNKYLDMAALAMKEFYEKLNEGEE